MLDSPKDDVVNNAIEYSLAYYVTDALVLVLISWDKITFMHHVLVISGMLPFRIFSDSPGQIIMVGSAVGEWNNLFWNGWNVLHIAGYHGLANKALPLNLGTLILSRGILWPAFSAIWIYYSLFIRHPWSLWLEFANVIAVLGINSLG